MNSREFPPDYLSAEESPTSAEKTIAGYYLDSSYTTPFAAATTEVAEGGTLDVYVKTEDKTAEQIIVTVDYVPHAYTPGSTNFKFEAPCAPELPQAQLTATTYTFNTGTTGAEILAAIGNPPEHQFWRPDVHEYGNCYWYISVSDVSQTPAPFNPVGFSLSESIMLFPQFTADMSYEPVVIKRVATDLHLSSPRDSLAAATIYRGEIYMAIPAVLAEGIAQSIGTLAETGLKGIGTFLDGINNIINPSDQVPPMVGMTPIA